VASENGATDGGEQNENAETKMPASDETLLKRKTSSEVEAFKERQKERQR
jgi:hypothetical protein